MHVFRRRVVSGWFPSSAGEDPNWKKLKELALGFLLQLQHFVLSSPSIEPLFDLEFSSKFIEMSLHPEVLWAQRSDKVYLTIALPDAKNVSVNSEPQGLFSFSAMGPQGKSFDFSLELYGTIVPKGSKIDVGLRNIHCSILKEQKGWWKRLLKSDEKPAPYIKVDWNKWCDEDEEESIKSDVASDDDGVADIGEDESSDDEGMLYLPDLEKARGN
ncbi:hypothetical protein HHK36_016978 [Tetracentron sinense]|uniref:Co-chaperone protein p23 n=1 Tax=Tetracentron sinense TaxID=13715 RepID=A0A834Z1K5_TETSI|nr:hypothetical protein HHK36_016978 [Tetracentron sinense]